METAVKNMDSEKNEFNNIYRNVYSENGTGRDKSAAETYKKNAADSAAGTSSSVAAHSAIIETDSALCTVSSESRPQVRIRISRLRPEAILPFQASPQAAGFDLYACTGDGSISIPPQTVKLVGTGLALAIPDGYFGAVFARSGLALKQGLRPANCVGVCDSDYRGEYFVPLYNDSSSEQTIRDGDRIAQLVILPCPLVSFEECQNLNSTKRGTGGLGSTGSA